MGKRFAALSIFLLLLIALWFSTAFSDASVGGLPSVHRLFGILGMGLLLIQFILSSRIKRIERGFGLDRMLWYHRWFGRAAVGFIFVHVVMVLTLNWGFWHWTGHRIPALIALGIIVVAATAASMNQALRLRYELWKGIHVANYLAFPVALLHVFGQPWPGLFWLWIALALVYALIIGHRVYSLYLVRRHPFSVADVIRENEDTWTLRFAGQTPGYLPGQFLHLQLRRYDGLSSSHPFTMSSSPTQPLVSITSKAVGDFTATLRKTETGDQAYIDAPYGIFSFLNAPEDRPLVFIAGGIGITPFMSMLRYMRDLGIERDVHLIWANKHEQNLLFQEELAEIDDDLPGLKVLLVMSNQADWAGERGRVDIDMLTRHLSDLREYEFFLCGPPPMTLAINQQLASAGVPPHQISREVFSL